MLGEYVELVDLDTKSYTKLLRRKSMSTFIKEALKIAQAHIDARDVLSDTPENVIALVLSEAVELLQAENEELEKALRFRQNIEHH